MNSEYQDGDSLEQIAKNQDKLFNQLKEQASAFKVNMNVSENSKYTFTQFSRIQNSFDDIFCVKFDPTDTMLALGAQDGMVYVNYLGGKCHQKFEVSPQDQSPTTCIRWRPNIYSQSGQQILVTGNSEGTITHWHLKSGKQLSRIEEKDNHVLTLDYQLDGKRFVTAGKDCNIRIYDEATKYLESTLEAGTWNQSGHNNRIFCVKYVEDDQNCIISGGWDSTIHIWDIRVKKSVGQIYGPSISGDALDCKNGQILTGSYRNHEQLQLYDLRTLGLVQDIDLNHSNSYLYCAQFGKLKSNFIGCGSTGQNEVSIFNVKNDYKLEAKFDSMQKGIYGLDFSNQDGKIAFTSGNGVVFVVKYQ